MGFMFTKSALSFSILSAVCSITQPGGAQSVLDVSKFQGDDGFVIDGRSLGDRFGGGISGAGDINGDGIDDMVMGATNDMSNSPAGPGQGYVVFGRGNGMNEFPASLNVNELDGSNGFVIQSLDGESISSAVAVIGDVNGDLIDDLAVGSRSASPDDLPSAGIVYILFGRDVSEGNIFPPILALGELAYPDGIRIQGITEGDNIGLVRTEDLNNDGLSDLVLGAHSSTGPDSPGRCYVVFGDPMIGGVNSDIDLAALNGSNGFVINGKGNGDSFCLSFDSAGDFNGDGVGDLIIGAVNASLDVPFQAGESYVIFGQSDGFFPAVLEVSNLDGINGISIAGISSFDRAGVVAGLGDFNGDGVDDIGIGALGVGITGAAYVLFGQENALGQSFPATILLSDLDGTNGFSLMGGEANELAGFSVAGAGDFNDDGLDDLIVGAPLSSNAPTGSRVGRAYVVLGNQSSTTSLNLSDLEGDTGFDVVGQFDRGLLGFGVTAAGDVNADGFDDIVVSQPGFLGEMIFEGSAYVIFGGNRPIITSDPVTQAVVGSNYVYQVRAENIAGSGGLTFEGIQQPSWLSVQNVSDNAGVLTGVPGPADVGKPPVILSVTNPTGATADQQFNIVVRGQMIFVDGFE